ncbi:hypothetical protein [Marinobacterium rhizophilum]|uniref:hypothetical protein n=1 Tax=Marinobacterium rhizophilum TaxID=420402 RepID=UPI00035D813F|nr:hypothetical protein [Marinobacterium rhizophilum]
MKNIVHCCMMHEGIIGPVIETDGLALEIQGGATLRPVFKGDDQTDNDACLIAGLLV